MNPLVPVLGLASAMAVAVYAWQSLRSRQAARSRLFSEARDAPTEEETVSRRRPSARPLIRRHYVWPWFVAVLAGIGFCLLGVPAVFATTFALIVGIVLQQADTLWYAHRNTQIEMQLADAIDLMVGALSAGAGVTAGLEAVLREARLPLRPVVEEVVGRLRYGDDPQQVFRDIALRVPLETFLLFSTTLAVHWEVGGSLRPILASLGRTVRDRIETGRRIRSNTVQAQFSAWAVLGVTYLIAAIMWRSGPERVAEFVRSPSAHWFIAGAMLLQALGMVWMASLARMRF